VRGKRGKHEAESIEERVGMKRKKTFMVMLKRACERFRREGFLSTLLRCMKLAGIQITPFYLMSEGLPPEISVGLTALPEGFEFSIFCLNDIKVISNLPERESYSDSEDVIDNFNKGEMCFGIKCSGQIVAFTWVSFEKSPTKLYRTAMRKNEAYFHDMYVLKAFRGNNLAPILRYKSYEALRDMGRDTFYSITDFFNTASFRFKQKLNAKVVFLGVYIELFNKWYQGLWVVKRY
jgi:hypothetical protein